MVYQVVVVIVVEICHFFLFMAPSTIIYLPFLHSILECQCCASIIIIIIYPIPPQAAIAWCQAWFL